MNWRRGIRRLAGGVLAVFWMAGAFFALTNGETWERNGFMFGQMAFFSIVYLLGYAVLEWIVRGIFRDKPPSK